MRLISKTFIGLSALFGWVALAPQLASTTLGNRLLTDALSDILGHRVHFKASLGWFKPVEAEQISYSHPQFELVADKLLTDQTLVSWLFTSQKATLNLQNFEIIWGKKGAIRTHQASLLPVSLPMALSKPMLIELQGGRVAQGPDIAIDKLEGFVDIVPFLPISIHLKGICNPSGQLSFQGKIDPKSFAGEIDIEVKQCSKNALPDFTYKANLAPFFNASIHYKGTPQEGFCTLAILADNFSINGGIGKQDDRFYIQEKTTLSYNAKIPFRMQKASLNNLQFEFSIDKGSIENFDLKTLQDLEASLTASATELLIQNQSKGTFSTKAYISQHQSSPLTIQAQVIQKEIQLLELKGTVPLVHNHSGHLLLTTQKFPLALVSDALEKKLGSTLSSTLDLTFEEGFCHFNWTGNTPYLIDMESSGTLRPTIVELKNFQGTLVRSDFQGQLQLKNTQIPYRELNKSTLELDFILMHLQGAPKELYPLKMHIDGKNLDELHCDFKAPIFNLHGIGVLDPIQLSFSVKDKWLGSFNLPPSAIPYAISKKFIKGNLVLLPSSNQGSILAEITFEPISLVNAENLALSETKAKMEYNLKTQAFKGDLKGLLKETKGASGSFAANVLFNKNQLVYALLKVQNPPIEGLGNMHPRLHKWVNFFGKNLQGSVEISQSGGTYLSQIKAHSENLHLEAGLGLQKSFYLTRPLALDLHLTSLDLPFFENPPPFNLKKPSDINLRLQSFNLPLKGGTFEDLDCQGELLCQNIALIEGQKLVHLEALQGTLDKKKGQNQLDFVFHSDIYSSSSKAMTTGSLLAKGHLSELRGPLKDLDFSKASIFFNMQTEAFPTLLLDFFTTTSALPFSTTLGTTLNGRCQIQHSPQTGLIDVDMGGGETRLKFQARKNQNLYGLSEDALFQTRISPELSGLFFKKHPMGIEKIVSAHPIALRIPALGTEFTLFPFQIKKLKLPQIVLDLGKVHLLANGLFPTALSLLKASPKSPDIEVWFQPITAAINQGLLDLPRFDFLVSDQFQMALWGGLDLFRQQVGMILGLTASCLQRAFNIGNLPKSYVLQIPISGSLDDIKIDTKKATAKIAKIIALNQGGALIEQFGGKQGAIIGGLMKQLSKLPDGDKETPDPKLPFPWETQNQKTASSEPRKKPIRSSDSPAKQLLRLFF